MKIVSKVLYIAAIALYVGALGTLSQPVMAQSTPQSGVQDERTGNVISGRPAKCARGDGQSFLTFPAWYKGLVNDNCEVLSPTDSRIGGVGNFIWRIALNGVEIILNLVGYASVGYLMYGGYKYMISAGSPDGMASGKKTILNAVIGLVISIAAVALVRSVSSGFGVG